VKTTYDNDIKLTYINTYKAFGRHQYIYRDEKALECVIPLDYSGAAALHPNLRRIELGFDI